MKTVKQFGETVEGYNIPVLNEREIRASAGILYFFMLLAWMLVIFQESFFLIKFVNTIFLTDFIIRVMISSYPVKTSSKVFYSRKPEPPVLFQVIGRMGSSLTMEHIIRWVGSSSTTFSQPFYRPSTSHDYPTRKKIWKS